MIILTIYLLCKLFYYVCIWFPIWLISICLRLIFSPFILLLGIPLFGTFRGPNHFSGRDMGGFTRGGGFGRR